MPAIKLLLYRQEQQHKAEGMALGWALEECSALLRARFAASVKEHAQDRGAALWPTLAFCQQECLHKGSTSHSQSQVDHAQPSVAQAYEDERMSITEYPLKVPQLPVQEFYLHGSHLSREAVKATIDRGCTSIAAQSRIFLRTVVL